MPAHAALRGGLLTTGSSRVGYFGAQISSIAYASPAPTRTSPGPAAADPAAEIGVHKLESHLAPAAALERRWIAEHPLT